MFSIVLSISPWYVLSVLSSGFVGGLFFGELLDEKMALDIMLWCFENSYWPGYSEFEMLKCIYRGYDLQSKTIDRVMDILKEEFFKLKKDATGIIELERPAWYKE